MFCNEFYSRVFASGKYSCDIDHAVNCFANAANRSFVDNPLIFATVKVSIRFGRFIDIPFMSRTYKLLAFYSADGFYSDENIEFALKEVFGTDKSILDCSYATSTRTRIGLPVVTVSIHPSYRISTNYNGVGARDEDQGEYFRDAEENPNIS